MSAEERVTDLEIRLTHLDDTVDQLNQIIIDQQDRISRLERTLKEVLSDHERLKEAVSPDIVDSPPPHY
ncbi:SlyX family protein [Saccharospirillum salsuginis]|uniref:SlyX protein n=1 Tax=Saccharospirillum salsuginis TaxID=418750 RepID=A0A918KJ15_9GAMM|nr:SlyX family protein [Saccharospirillum salsuginis]GGX64486.1 hypothetical protein GCM10007392_35340 [Saccharospirillum salsuginis]